MFRKWFCQNCFLFSPDFFYPPKSFSFYHFLFFLIQRGAHELCRGAPAPSAFLHASCPPPAPLAHQRRWRLGTADPVAALPWSLARRRWWRLGPAAAAQLIAFTGCSGPLYKSCSPHTCPPRPNASATGASPTIAAVDHDRALP